MVLTCALQPNFFYGSLLFYFGIEISLDWFVHAYAKVTRAEYALLVAGFLAILAWGLEGGIAIGIVLATLYFAFAYAQVCAALSIYLALPYNVNAMWACSGLNCSNFCVRVIKVFAVVHYRAPACIS